MPPIAELEIFGTEQTTELKHEAGFVYLIDFWATWCPPCQKPMAHNCEMLKKHNAAGDWSNVRIIGLSIDDAMDPLVSHVNAKGWNAVTHYRVGPECLANELYEITGVPKVVIVNMEGIIVFMGHPAHRKDLDADLSALAKGEKLSS